MMSRIRPDIRSGSEVLCLHSLKLLENSLCPKPDSKLFRNNYLAALSLSLQDFSHLLKQYFRFRALQLAELQPLWKEWMRGRGINTLRQLQHGSEPQREFISTNWLPKASLLSKHNRWIHTFHIYVPSHLWAGEQRQSSCKRLDNNHYGSQLLSQVSLSSLLMQPSRLTSVIMLAE